MTTSQSDTKVLTTLCRWHRNPEAIRRADTEEENAMKRAKMLEERRAAKRASATPMDELEESPTNAEIPVEAMMVAGEAVLTENA